MICNLNNPHYDILNCEIPSNLSEKKSLIDELLNRVKITMKLRQHSDSILLYSRLIKIIPQSNYYSNRSYLYILVGHYQLALEDANRTIILDNKWWKGYFRKAVALEKLGIKKSSLTYYNKALQNTSSIEFKEKINKKINTLNLKLNNNNREIYTDNNVIHNETDECMKGYIVKPNGVKTTYFNRDISDDIIKLIGTNKPKKLN